MEPICETKITLASDPASAQDARERASWTKAQLGTTKKGQRWSDLMTIVTWQLWLAREIIEDNPLPWQKPQPKEKLTPGRVAQSFNGVLVAISTPAQSPKPRGKSPGWPKGKIRTKKSRFPVIKKGKGKFESQKKAKEESKSA